MTNTHEVTDVTPNAATHEEPKITDVTAQAIRRTYLAQFKVGVESTKDERIYSSGIAAGIVETLNYLGIEIEKVNDVKAEVDGL